MIFGLPPPPPLNPPFGAPTQTKKGNLLLLFKFGIHLHITHNQEVPPLNAFGQKQVSIIQSLLPTIQFLEIPLFFKRYFYFGACTLFATASMCFSSLLPFLKGGWDWLSCLISTLQSGTLSTWRGGCCTGACPSGMARWRISRRQGSPQEWAVPGNGRGNVSDSGVEGVAATQF